MSIHIDKKFEFPGSISHASPRLKFTILHMYLKINPDFEKKQLLDCEERLLLKAKQNINEITLDIAELKIKQIGSDNIKIEKYQTFEKEDKLIIKFKDIVKKDFEFDIQIKYSAGYQLSSGNPDITFKSPRSGFHFIIPDSSYGSSAIQSWTQGETMESRYWFPCIDDPQVKFTREIEVIAPDDEYLVISNGTYEKDGNTWKWKESTPNPAYLTSIVIGKFHKYEDTSRNISLEYYWPKDIPNGYDPMLTFGETPQMMDFFQEYLDTQYPYEKYWQVAVDKFEFGGMENTSCSTLTSNILHDSRASLDYSRDIIVVAHELAHQWFGDLVTCKNWSHIWLNEGFANYFESLYWKHRYRQKYHDKDTNDDFLYKIMQMTDDYIDEANSLYKRPIVTNIYKHPDELFDSHSYEKGGLVLYMLSNLIGEDNFKKVIKKYLDIYKKHITETEDFQKICEDIYGEDLQQFFYQWLYTAGHPELEIQFSLEKERSQEGQIRKIKVKVTQIQQKDFIFSFPLEMRLVCANYKNGEILVDKIENIEINKKVTDYTFKKEINSDAIIEWISIDPKLKVLKEIKSIIINNQNKQFNLTDILEKPLKSDKTTIAERISSLRLLKDCYTKEIVGLVKDVILTDRFYGVSVEAANVLGSYHDKKNYIKDNDAYEGLEKCLINKNFLNLSPQIKRSIISNIGLFERKETLELKDNDQNFLLKTLLDDKSYAVGHATATTIGKCIKHLSNGDQYKLQMVNELKDKINLSTFQDQIAQGAINGLRELANDENIDLVHEIAMLLIHKSSKFDSNSNLTNRYYVRAAAILALGKFLVTKNEKIVNDTIMKAKAEKMNKEVFEHLLKLLSDESRRIKNNVCTALADKDAKVTKPTVQLTKSIESLQSIAEKDVDGFVRRVAEVNLNLIREWLKEWTATPPELEINIRKEVAPKKKEEIPDEEKEEVRKERSEKNNEYERIQRTASKDVLEY